MPSDDSGDVRLFRKNLPFLIQHLSLLFRFASLFGGRPQRFDHVPEIEVVRRLPMRGPVIDKVCDFRFSQSHAALTIAASAGSRAKMDNENLPASSVTAEKSTELTAPVSSSASATTSRTGTYCKGQL